MPFAAAAEYEIPQTLCNVCVCVSVFAEHNTRAHMCERWWRSTSLISTSTHLQPTTWTHRRASQTNYIITSPRCVRVCVRVRIARGFLCTNVVPYVIMREPRPRSRVYFFINILSGSNACTTQSGGPLFYTTLRFKLERVCYRNRAVGIPISGGSVFFWRTCERDRRG